MILGLTHQVHDAAAALVGSEGLIAAAEEERFNRIKHSDDFPRAAIEYCLTRVGEADQLEGVAVPQTVPIEEARRYFGPEATYHDVSAVPDDHREEPSLIERVASTVRNNPTQLPRRAAELAARRLSEDEEPPPVSAAARAFDWPVDLEVYHCNHHEAHAASAYHACGTSDALVVTLDGIGDGFTGSVWIGADGDLTLRRTFPRDGSLGWFYGLVTEALGWKVANGEGKTMGLAAGTEPDAEVVDALRQYCPRYRDGELETPSRLHPHAYRAWGGTHSTFEEADAVRELIEQHGRERTAAAAQALLEEQVLEIVGPWLERTGQTTVATAGGVFLNVTLNRRLGGLDPVEEYFVFPAANDAGLAAGAAMRAQAALGQAPDARLEHVAYGPDLGDCLPEDESVPRFLTHRGLTYRQPSDLTGTVADRLAEGDLIAWCRGRMEYGPRALGQRSILADPTREDSKDRVNERVKFRESWRPFAPSVLERALETYFVAPRADPFMVTACEVRPERREEIPAVVHVDGTARPQVVRRSVTPDYWALLDAFAERTGVPVLLNTSFNLSGDPIVCSPSDAVKTFFDSGLDLLVLGDVLVEKSEAPTSDADQSRVMGD